MSGSRTTTLGKRLRAAGLGVVLFVTTAGACQQEYEGELPTPEEMGARPFPTTAATTGLDATFAQLTRQEQDGTQCFFLIRLTTQGESQLDEGCSTLGVEVLVAEERTWSSPDQLGDYAHRDGRLWLRTVRWDYLEERLVVAVSEFISCGTELRSPEPRDTYVIVHPNTLVAGAMPPDTPPCP